jgi:hypothetical protein
MKVCDCCYNPMIIESGPFAALAQQTGYIVVPDDTPRISEEHISHTVLEEAGLKWDDDWSAWRTPDGKFIDGSYDITITENREMEPWERQVMADKALVIPFLKSTPKDDSTLGSGDHTKRQAKVLLQLFRKYVIGDFVGNSERYEIARLGDFENPLESIMGNMGQFRQVKDAIETDRKTLEDEDVNPSGDDARAKQWHYKLLESLVPNYQVLSTATALTQSTYDLHTEKAPVDQFALIMGTFAARHSTDSTSAVVRTLYDAMLPILVAKLVQSDFPDSQMTVKWDYGEQSKARGMQMIAMSVEAMGAKVEFGISQKQTARCGICGHEIEFCAYQELDIDQSPKGDVQARGLPDVCPNCKSQSPEKKDS